MLLLIQLSILLSSAQAKFCTASHPSAVNNKQCSHEYPPCNPIKTWSKWDHYDCGSPKSISAGVNYHRVARVQEQSCTLSLIETTPPSQLSSLTTVMLCLMDVIKYYAPCSLNVPVHIFSRNRVQTDQRSAVTQRLSSQYSLPVSSSVFIMNSRCVPLNNYPLNDVLNILCNSAHT